MATLYVGADQAYTTIKAALEAAADGDTVLIKAGTYDEVVTFAAKGNKNNVTIAGETDAEGKSLVNWKGSLSLAMDEKTTWNDIKVKDINFINTTGSGSCVSLQECYRWTFENCSFSSEAHQGAWGWNPIAFPAHMSNYGHTIKNCTLTGGTIATRVANDATVGYGLKVVDCTIVNTNFNIQAGGTFDVIFENNDITIKYDDFTLANREGKDNAFIVTKQDVTKVNIAISGGTLSMVGNKVPVVDKGWTAICPGAKFSGTIAINGVEIKNETDNPFISNFTNTASTATLKVDLTGNTFVDAEGNVITDAAEIAKELLNLKIGNVAVDYSNYKDADGNLSGEKGFFIREDNNTTVIFTQNGTCKQIINGVESEMDISKLYVCDAWADLAGGTNVDGKIIGVNAFAKFDDAVAALADNNTTIALLSDAVMNADPAYKLNVISGNGNEYKLQVSATIDVDAEFAKEINIDTDLFCAYYNNHTVVVNGDLKGGFYNYTGSLTFNNSKITDSYDNSNIGGTVNINGDGTWTMDNAQADNLKYINVGRSDWLGQGILNLKDTVVKAIAFNVDSSSAEAKSQINAVNSTIATVLNDGMVGDITVGTNGEINLTNSDLLVVGTLKNNGTITVSGASAISAKVTGDGWIGMDNAALDADTNIQGGKVRFTNGTSTLSGAVVNSNAFQVGWGAYEATDPRETVADVVVNVTNNSYIHSVDNDYYGWVGTGWFGSDAEKAAAMTDARYTLNITNSIANFGYFHVSTDGILNVTGNAAEKESYTGVSYSYYGGRTMINGVATFDNVDALVQYTNVSCDNGTDVPGKLVIKNGANYVSWLDSSSDIESFKISKTGVVEVDNAFVDARHGTLIAADASLEVKNGGEFKGKIVTNNGTVNVDGAKLTVTEKLANTGTVNVSGESTLNIADLSVNAVQAADGATLKDSSVGGTVQMLGDLTLLGDNSFKTIKGINGGTLTLEAGKTLALNNFSFGDSSTKDSEYVISGGKITANYGFFQHGTYTLESDFETGYMYYSYGSDITVKGSFHSQGKGDGLDYVRGNLTVANGGESIHDKSLWVGQPASWGAMEASLTVKAGGKVQANSLQVYEGSSMTIEVGATVIANSFTNAGTLTVSGVAGMDQQKYLLVDVNSETDFGNVVVDIDNYTLGIIDNDLYLVNCGTILVNAAFGVAGAEIPEGYVLGVNAFASLEQISADASQGVRTIKYTADESGALEIGITSVAGRTDYVINGIGRYVSSGKTATETVAVTEGKEYTFVFSNESADFELTGEFTEANGTENVTLTTTATGAEFAANGKVAEALGAKEFVFNVTGTADLSFTLALTYDGKVEYTLLDSSKNTVLHGYSGSAIRRKAEDLAAGTYTLVVESLNGKNAEFTVDGTIEYKVTGPSKTDYVNTADNAFETAAAFTPGSVLEGWVGNMEGAVDGIDFIDVTTAIQNGRNYFSITATGNAKATIWTLSSRGVWVDQLHWDITDETDTRSLRCTAGKQYVISIESDNDSSYTMQLS